MKICIMAAERDRVMGVFNFKETKIEGLYVVEMSPFIDDRGYFVETYNEKDFFEKGLKMKFVQENESYSKKGVLRGLHFQKKFPQGKLVRCLEGKVFDVAVDLRKGSKTFGRWEAVLLSEDNFLQFYIPEGFAHGFLVLSQNAKFSYMVTNLYNKEDEGSVLWNDEEIGIEWPLKGEQPILSEKDKKNPKLRDIIF